MKVRTLRTNIYVRNKGENWRQCSGDRDPVACFRHETSLFLVNSGVCMVPTDQPLEIRKWLTVSMRWPYLLINGGLVVVALRPFAVINIQEKNVAKPDLLLEMPIVGKNAS